MKQVEKLTYIFFTGLFAGIGVFAIIGIILGAYHQAMLLIISSVMVGVLGVELKKIKKE